MKNFISANKKIIIWIIVILLLVLGYLILFKGPSEPTSGVVRVSATERTPVGNEILKNLNKINALNLNKNIFTDPIFLNLKDFGEVIPSQIKGKNSPFDPIGVGKTSQE